MRAWVPVPGTTSGRLVEAALTLFGSRGFGPVSVSEIAAGAGVTTGALYHHFESKAGLYDLVRGDVEQRVVDRIEGAAAVRPIEEVRDLAPVLLVGFDYLVRTGYARLLGETSPIDAHNETVDPVSEIVDRLLPGTAPLAALIASAWRTALWRAAASDGEADAARAALAHLLRAS